MGYPESLPLSRLMRILEIRDESSRWEERMHTDTVLNAVGVALSGGDGLKLYGHTLTASERQSVEDSQEERRMMDDQIRQIQRLEAISRRFDRCRAQETLRYLSR